MQCKIDCILRVIFLLCVKDLSASGALTLALTPDPHQGALLPDPTGGHLWPPDHCLSGFEQMVNPTHAKVSMPTAKMMQ